MVSNEELALALIQWVALFLPALAIMLNTLTGVYDSSELLQLVGIAESKKRQIITISGFGFILSFMVLMFSLLHLVTKIELSIWSDFFLIMAIIAVSATSGFVAVIIIDTYRAGQIDLLTDTGNFEEYAAENPATAVRILEVLIEQNQISQAELNYVINNSNLGELLKEDQQED